LAGSSTIEFNQSLIAKVPQPTNLIARSASESIDWLIWQAIKASEKWDPKTKLALIICKHPIY
jgi:hypothetical protein